MRVALVGRDSVIDAVLERCRSRVGVLLAGPAGVGKSRLLDEVIERLRPDLWFIEFFVATEATRLIPFGPMFTLVPPEGGDDRGQLLTRVRAQLMDRAGGRRTVVAVDDAHLLDDFALACITDMAHRGDATVLLTARPGEQMPPTLTELWAGSALERIDVEPLNPVDTTTLAEAFLDGPVDEPLREDLVSLSGGKPLFLRELLLDAQASGTIEKRDGTWRLVGPLHAGRHLRELAASRVRRLAPREARLLDTIAVGEPVDIALLDDREGVSLDALERSGLARVDERDGGWAAHPDHPLIGEAIREALPTRRRAEVLRDLAERVVRAGCPHQGDSLRAAQWCLAAGEDPSAETAAEGSVEALAALDLALAARLADIALTDHESCEPLLVLGNVRRLEGDPDGAEAALARAAELAPTDEQLGRIATLRSFVQVHHYGQTGLAIELLEQAATAVTDQAVARRLMSSASSFAGMLGRYDDVLRTTRRVLSLGDLDRDTAWTTLVNMLYAQVMLGQLEGVEDDFEQALDPAYISEMPPDVRDLLWALRAGVFIQRGALADGERVLDGYIRSCRASATMHGAAAAIYLQLLVYRATPRFFPAVEETLQELDTFDPLLVRPVVLGGAALAHALCGQLDEAVAALELVPETRGDPRVRPFVGRGQAAIAALTGEVELAAQILIESGREAVATTHIAFGVTALYDAVRYGHADLVTDDLVEAVADCDALLLRAMADHAVAARDRDGKALDAAADTFATMGAPQLAATAYAQAADAYPADDASARRSAARSALWGQEAHPFISPEPVCVERALSRRELEVAARAAAGPTSQEIAEEMFVSVRTVDNHLREVYRKLEVAGRADLADVLSPLPDGLSS